MYYGLRGQADNMRMSEEEHRLLKEFIAKEEEFEKTLTPEQIKMYEDTQWASEDVNVESCGRCFAEGFRFGVLMGMDILKE